MRGTVAKRLRRTARENTAGHFWPERDVLVVNIHEKKYPWLAKKLMGTDGVAIIVDGGVRTVAQHINSRQSERGYYRGLKALYKKVDKHVS